MASVCEIRSKWNTGSAERSSSCVRTGVGPIHGALDVLLVVVLSACAGAAAVNDPASLTDLPADGAVETLPTDSQPAGESAEFVTFRIEPSASEVRFVIGEILGGAPNTVIGVNDQVSGEILISVSNPAASRIGPIEIGADSFVTDSALRNRAINQFVLQSGIYPLITFTPTAIGGIPGKVSSGTVLTLQIAGKLTIREVTQPVGFEATITVVSESEIRGNAAATISRSDFELTIPSVPRVAGVDEELVLEFDFVALAE
jgi:polyisoprenoid-binding protein YceI